MKTTIADIAREAGVSKATVSRVLNQSLDGVGVETRLRIKEIMEQRQFEPCGVARGLATGKTRSVGLVVPDIADPFFPLLIRGIEAALGNRGYGLFLCDAHLDPLKEKEHLRMLAEKRVDGVILNSTLSDADGPWDALDHRSIPYVLLDRMVDAPESAYGVFTDNRLGARMATEHLLKNGRRLAFINGPAGLAISKLRRQGVEDALRARGLGWQAVRTANGDYSLESGERALESLWEPGTVAFDAVFAANDRMAIGAMRALQRRGILVPDDVEVVGFDDIETARLVEPPLTTVAQPAFEMGRRAAEVLLALIGGESPTQRTIVLEPTLMIRKTTRQN
jgi:LacI family transcriptional regulator